MTGHLPDIDGAIVVPAADGIPHRKACPECAFRTNDPQHYGRDYQQALRWHDGTGVFYCLHREPVRVCACYAAINGVKTSVNSGSCKDIAARIRERGKAT